MMDISQIRMHRVTIMKNSFFKSSIEKLDPTKILLAKEIPSLKISFCTNLKIIINRIKIKGDSNGIVKSRGLD